MFDDLLYKKPLSVQVSMSDDLQAQAINVEAIRNHVRENMALEFGLGSIDLLECKLQRCLHTHSTLFSVCGVVLNRDEYLELVRMAKQGIKKDYTEALIESDFMKGVR